MDKIMDRLYKEYIAALKKESANFDAATNPYDDAFVAALAPYKAAHTAGVAALRTALEEFIKPYWKGYDTQSNAYDLSSAVSILAKPLTVAYDARRTMLQNAHKKQTQHLVDESGAGRGAIWAKYKALFEKRDKEIKAAAARKIAKRK